MYMHIICFHLVHCDRDDSNDDGDGDGDDDEDDDDDGDHCDDYIHRICIMTNIYIIIDEYTLGGLS
jgi:hypothetical protein